MTVMAPTGKAALQVCGVTLHSKDGLSLPIDAADAKDLTGVTLKTLQDNYQHCLLIVIDEYSFLSLFMLYWIDRRLQQAKANNLPFGGLFVLLTGDPAQLPPVGGQTLWAIKDRFGRQLSITSQHSSQLYRAIELVFILTKVERLEPGQVRYGTFLNNLAKVQVTMEDWEYINATCTMDERFEQCFRGPDSVWLFPTNVQANEHNEAQLIRNDQPILRLKAEHDTVSSKNRSAQRTSTPRDWRWQLGRSERSDPL